MQRHADVDPFLIVQICRIDVGQQLLQIIAGLLHALSAPFGGM